MITVQVDCPRCGDKIDCALSIAAMTRDEGGLFVDVKVNQPDLADRVAEHCRSAHAAV